MKINLLKILSLGFVLALAMTSCKDSDKDFGNEAYMANKDTVTNLIFRSDIHNDEQTIKTSMARPEDHEVTIKYEVDESKVGTFNQGFYSDAVLLRKQFYSFPDRDDVINVGAVTSNGTTIYFENLSELDTDSVYVLPIGIKDCNISTMAGKTINYYVFKGAALINVVPSMVENFFLTEGSFANPSALNNLKQLTMEGLIYVNNFKNEGKSFISTFMGIEGKFLLRFGDAGFPENQLQVATNKGNVPGSSSAKGCPIGEWFHIAVTFDGTDNGAIQIYLNGKLQSSANISGLSSVNLGVTGWNGFQIGRSYSDDRYLNGMMSECRIWNVVRTQEEIAANFYIVSPDSEGLVAYWKMNEGQGNAIKDYTSNGNDLLSPVSAGVTWIDVSLPAKN